MGALALMSRLFVTKPISIELNGSLLLFFTSFLQFKLRKEV